jgi:hypothetical protein
MCMNRSSDDRRRRVRLTGPVRPARRVGEPNVLSDAAVPNTLSTSPAPPARAQPATRSGSESWLATGTAAPAAGRRLPSFGTLIFLVFLAITGFRLFGEFIRGLEATPTPAIVAPGQAVVPGSIVFGTQSDGDCGVEDRGYEFAPGTEVWWSARLSSEQAPDAEVVVVVGRDGAEVGREDVPADTSVGTWSVLCSGKPVDAVDPGTYRVELRDASGTVVHAVGEFRLVAS